jgi:glycosyltransferase involved in cell wall biosynthesis
VSDNVGFKEIVDHDELSKYFNSADIGLWTGKLGITVLEAVSSGLPVIVSDDPATEFIVDNNNGLTYSEGDVEALADQIKKYLNDPAMRERHGANGRQLVENKLSWEKIAAKSIECYRSY